jgi:hypothetical protein
VSPHRCGVPCNDPVILRSAVCAGRRTYVLAGSAADAGRFHRSLRQAQGSSLVVLGFAEDSAASKPALSLPKG